MILSQTRTRNVRTFPIEITAYREIFKSEYTRVVMRGNTVSEGIFAGAQAVRKAIGDDVFANRVLETLRARLGDVLGVGQ